MTTDAAAPRVESVEALRCRDEILEALYWLRGEGFEEEMHADRLRTFLAVDEALLREQLRVLTRTGFLEE